MEQLLHYCWKHRLFPLHPLETTNGQKIEVLDVGLYNTNAGSDFLNAKIKLDDTVWVGNVEIHTKSSDWYVHQHQKDANYNNVILHVTGCADTEVCTESGRKLPQLVLEVPENVQQHYTQLLLADKHQPCYEVIAKLPQLTLHSWMSALQIERLEQKTNEITQRLNLCKGDWEQTLFITLARNYGFGINGEVFEQWAMNIPLHSVDHHRDDLFQIEAFFMGQAGLLEDGFVPQKYLSAMSKEGYFEQLRTEYLYLKHKFGLQPIDGHLWKFLRLRPQNFPYIRIAQLAKLYHLRTFGIRNLLNSESIKALKETMKTAVSAYWQTHYMFGSMSKRSEKHLSDASLNVLLINTAIPMLFAYGRLHGEENLCEKAFDYLEELKPESNHIIKRWQLCGIKIENAGDTQALIQLQKKYCDTKDCLRCRIGYEYLKAIHNS